MQEKAKITKLKINKTEKALRSEAPKFDQGTASCSLCGTCAGTDA